METHGDLGPISSSRTNRAYRAVGENKMEEIALYMPLWAFNEKKNINLLNRYIEQATMEPNWILQPLFQ